MPRHSPAGSSTSPDPPCNGVVDSGLTKRPWTDGELRHLFESAPDAMLVVDNRGRITLVNTMCERNFGYDRKELIGRQIEMLIPKRHRGQHPIHVATYFRDPHVRCLETSLELSALRKNGSEFRAEINLSPAETRDGMMVSCTIRDVTERARAKAAACEERILAEAIVETIREPLLVLDAELRVQSANCSFLETFRVTREETENRLVYDLGNRQWDIPDLRYLLEHVLPEQHQLNDFEVTHKFERIGHRIMVLNARALLREGDRPGLILLAIEDITDRRHAEQRLSRYYDELQHTNQELDRRNHELQEFAYVVSHDLRAPLVNIQGFGKELAMSCERLRSMLAKGRVHDRERRELESLLDEDIPESLDFITTSSAKMEALLAGVLQLSRVGRAPLTIRQLDINHMVSGILASLEYSIQQKNVSVHMESLPPCHGDQTQLDQVFSNLLDNALKYLDPKRPGMIRVTGRQDPHRVIYAIQDNGIGIAAEHQDSIYRVFHRLDPHHGVGEGLGLTIVRRALDRHGGETWLESQENEGSTFYVSLPTRQP